MKQFLFYLSQLSYAAIIFSLILAGFPNFIQAQESSSVELTWLGDSDPGIGTGVSWGVPFHEGEIKTNTKFKLTSRDGDEFPLQSWKLAYWPDGSLKWVGFATTVNAKAGRKFYLQPLNKGRKETTVSKLTAKEDEAFVEIDTGILQCKIPKSGNQIISSLKINKEEVSSGGQLVCILQKGPENEVGVQPEKQRFTGEISKVTIEQNGPVRAVVKIEGTHVADTGDRNWLPFEVRLYFYVGQQTVKMKHTIIYDGEQEEDFIRGLGVVFKLPMDEEVYNRHIRFSGEDVGLWNEPAQPLIGRSPLHVDGENLYKSQLSGERIPNSETFSEDDKFFLDNWASWNDFKLIQNSPEGFAIHKRTNDKSSWIDAGAGKRSRGMAFAGDVSGGLALDIRNFWQSYPASLEVRNMRQNEAEIRAWLWSPDGPAMDMRHYDTIPWGHTLKASYEDVQPGFSTPTGIARTSEILLFASSEVPSNGTLNQIADLGNNPPLLIASPEYLHSIPAFGTWSLPDRSTKGKAWIEDQLDKAFAFYQQEVEKRNWYGFWDYGDVMHAYDEDRHEWKYDIGGYAWANTELMPNMWLWYSYLRSGKEDIFRMAEAMLRHTSEVDVYHSGRFKGLGSRHNVSHWGDGAKEVRVAQAALGRFYYYLTTDERTGDLMHASVEASNKAIGNLDPLRLILKKNDYPTHARVGPDWFALVGNWMTEWERTGDSTYRDKIMAGVESFAEMPYGFFSGNKGAFGYDPTTNKVYQLNENDIGYSHLSVLMGGPEIAFELGPLLNDEKWDELWLQFSRLYGAPSEIIKKELGKRANLGDPGPWYARLPAYYAKTTGNEEYAKRAWDDFFGRSEHDVLTDFKMSRLEGNETLEPVYEVQGISTNNTAQWSLNAIQLLELIGEDLPEDHPRFRESE